MVVNLFILTSLEGEFLTWALFLARALLSLYRTGFLFFGVGYYPCLSLFGCHGLVSGFCIPELVCCQVVGKGVGSCVVVVRVIAVFRTPLCLAGTGYELTPLQLTAFIRCL